ncbi:carbonic anhydrase [Paraburkholderia sp. SIMBA_049]
MFVHRNIASLVVQTEMSLLSVLYAIDVLKVNQLIVCGHQGGGGVKAAMSDAHHGLIGNWLRHRQRHAVVLLGGAGRAGRARPLQPDGRAERHRAGYNLGKTHIVERAWRNGGRPYLNGRLFDLRSGYIHPRTSMINNGQAVQTVCKLHNS